MSTIAAIANATVIDATGRPPREASVIVEDDRIAGIEDSPSAKPDASETVNCGGRYLLPGLIDAHVHIGAVSYDFEMQQFRLPSSVLALLIAQRLREMLHCGFTTVRDAGGGDYGFKMAIEHGIIEGPRLLISNRPLSQTGGHGDMRTRSTPESYTHWDGEFGMTHVIADGIEEVRRAVREQIRRGADFVKIFASGGVTSPTDMLESRQYSLDELRTAVATADDSSRHVMAHALPDRAIRNCVEAGVRSVEHGNLLEEETAHLMAASGTYLVPTMLIYEDLANNAKGYRLARDVEERAIVAADRGRAALEWACKAGVKIGSGSDMLGEGSRYMAREIALQASIQGAHEAIISATRVNAELCGLHSMVGTIEPGKQADLIVVDGDPLSDPGLLGEPDKIALIMKGGRIVKRKL
jgi:imidazolonepropionase-like amidohydrolase